MNSVLEKDQSNEKKCSSQLNLEVVKTNKDILFGQLTPEKHFSTFAESE